MVNSMDRASARGADSRSDANNNSEHVYSEILRDLGFRSKTEEQESSGKLSKSAADTHLSFTDIFFDLKNGYDKFINRIDDIFGFEPEKPVTTGIDKGSDNALDNDGSVKLDANGQANRITYGDGSAREFSFNGREVSAFTDRSGREYKQDKQGEWLGPDGKPAQISNVNVMPDGTFSYKEIETNNVIVCNLDGSYKTVTPDQFGDLKFYPDSRGRGAENQRLEELAKQPDYLNVEGQSLLTELNKNGIDSVDSLYGSHIVFDGNGGDGGALYNQLIQDYPVKQRTSSHYPGTKTAQYQIVTGPDDSAVLFGLTPEGNTFIQFEHAVAGTSSHTNDYNLYALSTKT